MNNRNIKPISPFILFCQKVIPLAFDESMSYYECLCALTNYLYNNVTPAVNNNADAVTELQNYVSNYFSDLDVQQEINNKLDEMVEDGTLEHIINEQLFSELNTKYTKAIISYDTINDMIIDETIEENQLIYILGDKRKGDGFSGYYKITNSGNEDGKYCIKLNNNLYANLDNEIENNFYDNIYYEKERIYDTDCYYLHIPLNDNNNEQINFVVNPAQINPINNKTFTPNEHARYFNTNVTTNASLAIQINNQFVDGIVISNGKIIRDYSMQGILTDEYKYIGIKEDRTIKDYQANSISAQEMINDGVKNAVLTFGLCVKNGVIVENFEHYLKPDIDLFLGVKEDKEIIILACDGRNSSNLGLNYQTGGQLLINKGCIDVYCLDSGGSSSVNLKGNKINMNNDENGVKDRTISYLFDVKKTINNKPKADIYSYMGQTIQNLNMQLRRLINHKEPFILRTKLNIGQQTITPNPSTNGQLLTAYSLSAPSTNYITVENGKIKINLPEQYTSVLPYQIKIKGHITLHNTTGSNTSHFIYIMEDNNQEVIYRETISNDDYITITIDDLLNNLSSTHEYSIYINANNVNNTEVVYGKLYIEYIPKSEAYISI